MLKTKVITNFVNRLIKQYDERVISRLILMTFFGTLVIACVPSKELVYGKESNTLKIQQLTQNTFVHITYLDIPNYGKFACNGLVYFNGGEAIIFDTPTTDAASTELIDWVQNTMDKKIKAVVVNHFHEDCLGGLKTFHEYGITSYANQATITLAKEKGSVLPLIGFDIEQILQIGDSEVRSKYFGPAHSKDNIVSYLPKESVLFGGCMIKAQGASKGNINDADISEWPKTVEIIRKQYKKLKYVVPGHGATGGTDLLLYTIDLFEN